jgi:hypothetical protein
MTVKVEARAKAKAKAILIFESDIVATPVDAPAPGMMVVTHPPHATFVRSPAAGTILT